MASREERLQDPVTGPHRYRASAPRPPDGDLDLDALLPVPFGPTSGSSSATPIEIDVGFGRGASIFLRNTQVPGTRLLGIEIKTKWTTLVKARAAREGRGGVTIWCGDAREILQRVTKGACVTRVFLHFPDPWWKKRHIKRTVISAEFVDTLARLLKPGGEVFVQTDVPDRAQAHFAKLVAHDGFSVEWCEQSPFGLLSNRERRAAEDELPVHRFIATRLPCAAKSA